MLRMLRLKRRVGYRFFSTSSRRTATRDYNAAVSVLNTLQSNFSIVDAIRKSGNGMNKQAIPEMIEWAKKIGYEPQDFDCLNSIHIAGTKGKGSTSAFISSILGQYLSPGQPRKLQKIGLFTSPHLRFVRERIQINNESVSEGAFAKYFFEVWDRLEAAAKAEGIAPESPATKPMYFRFLTLMAFHAYVSEKVDTAVFECGIGGEYDSTNIIVSPSVTAVTSLGIDHVAMLGSTLPEIAWHKGGIFKPGAPAFTAPQPEEALTVLRQRAAERNADLTVVQQHPEVDGIKLGLQADFQKVNASLAIAVAAAHLRKLGYNNVPDPSSPNASPLPLKFRRGLEQVKWPGRCQIRREPQSKIMWHIDGGHTLESIEVAGQWFASSITSNTSAKPSSGTHRPRILLFNQQTRESAALAKALHTTLATALTKASETNEHPFTHAVFCTNITYLQGGYKADLTSINTNKDDVEALTVQNGLAKTWAEIDPQTQVNVVKTVQEAIEWCRQIAGQHSNDENVDVLVTGSLHLVGGVLEVLEGQAEQIAQQ